MSGGGWRLLEIPLILLLVTGAESARAEERPPWRLSAEAPLPDGLDVGLSHHSRMETLRNDFRAGSEQRNSTALVMRTLVAARTSVGAFFVELEGQDSRAYGTDGAPLGTSSVNAMELLHAHLGVAGQSVFSRGDQIQARLGRLTLDVGSRRLVARNRFRNTINGFTGADVLWKGGGHSSARAFVLVPVTRRPSDASSIAENEVVFDEENTDALFVGAFHARDWADVAKLELYLLGLYERDGKVASSNRRFLTPGARLYREPSAGRFDFEVEVVAQLGRSRASRAPEDTVDLDHRAFFGVAEAAYSAQAPWHPRLIAHLDYATGDDDPMDGINGRFDTLYGVRRFDLGPTGIYGAFKRENLITPGLRVQIKPRAEVSAFATYRLFWLASTRDAWTGAGLRDPTGDSGRFVGQQGEVRVRWAVFPRNLRLELGGAHLIRGEFARAFPDEKDEPATYFYTQISGTL